MLLKVITHHPLNHNTNLTNNNEIILLLKLLYEFKSIINPLVSLHTTIRSDLIADETHQLVTRPLTLRSYLKLKRSTQINRKDELLVML